MRIFISAGEPSGDLHGGHVARDLRHMDPAVELVGFGGKALHAAGVNILFDLPSLALMGFFRVLRHIPQLKRLVKQARQEMQQRKPDALLLIDYPGFHWHLAAVAKELGIPVYYYCPPQLWGWAPWRVKKLRRLVDHVLCCLPFEETYYRAEGCNCSLVGHPFFDDLTRRTLDQSFMSPYFDQTEPLVALLPGSRNHEVNDNLPQILKAAQCIKDAVPRVRFTAACYNAKHAEQFQEALSRSALPVDVYHGKTPELMSLADCAISVSGSVSLELMYYTTPSVMIYHTTWVGYALQAMFRKVKYITLVNLLNAKELHPKDLSLYHPDQPESERVLFPEYVVLGDRSREIAAHVIRWLTDSAERQRAVRELDRLKQTVAIPGSTRRVADFLMQRHSTSRNLAPSATSIRQAA